MILCISPSFSCLQMLLPGIFMHLEKLYVDEFFSVAFPLFQCAGVPESCLFEEASALFVSCGDVCVQLVHIQILERVFLEQGERLARVSFAAVSAQNAYAHFGAGVVGRVVGKVYHAYGFSILCLDDEACLPFGVEVVGCLFYVEAQGVARIG